MQKQTLMSVGFLAVVGGAVAFKMTRPDPHVRDAKSHAAPGVPTLKQADIDELELSEKDKPTIVLKKDGEGWKIAAPAQDRADQKSVESALQTLEKMKFKDAIAESPTSYEKLQVTDDQVLKVVPKQAGAALTTLLVGKTGRVRVEGDPRVWEVTDLSRYSLSRDVKMWRDREILRIEKDNLDKIEVAVAGAKVVAKREAPPGPGPGPGNDDPSQPKPPAGPDKWIVLEGEGAVGGTLDESVPASIFSAGSHLDAADFPDDVTAAGMDAPRARLAFVMKDGSKKELLLGNEAGEDVFVKRPDAPRIWKLRKSTAENLFKAPVQWRDKTLAKIDAKDVQKIDVLKGAEHLLFERTGDATWKAANVDELDSTKVQSLASAFTTLKALAIVESANPKATGLAKPTGTITVSKKDGSSTVLSVGAQDDKKNYYVRVTGRTEVFTLAEYAVNRFFKSPSEFKKSPPPPEAGM